MRTCVAKFKTDTWIIAVNWTCCGVAICGCAADHSRVLLLVFILQVSTVPMAIFHSNYFPGMMTCLHTFLLFSCIPHIFIVECMFACSSAALVLLHWDNLGDISVNTTRLCNKCISWRASRACHESDFRCHLKLFGGNHSESLILVE